MKIKNLHKILFFPLCFLLIHTFATAQIASWTLTADGNPSGVDANITAGIFTFGAGQTTTAFNADGARGNSWPTAAAPTTTDYFEISLSPNAGFQINISDVNFGERRSATGIREYQVQWSKDPTFAASTTISTTPVLDVTTERTGDIPGLNIDVLDGETIYIRWLGYSAESGTGTWRINDGTLNIAGAVSLAPIPPVPTMSEWGLIILALLVMNIGVLFSNAPQLSLSNRQSISAPINFEELPFQKITFLKLLIIISASTLIGFFVASFGFQYELTTADPFGSLVATGFLAYLFMQFRMEKI